ncbi:MAG: Holliday junction resolvase-like protein [Candidatus Nanoarchaeia archaeon]
MPADLTLIIFAIIFLIGIVIAYLIGHKFGSFKRDRHWESEIPVHRKDAISKSRAVLSGHFSEQLAPFLPDFPWNPTECKFLGKPIDFLVFEGADKGEIESVKFVEVKSGNSKLNKKEKSLKQAIEDKKVSWEEYRIPEDLTKGRDLED